MANINAALDNGKRQAEQAVRHASPWIEKSARLGYGAKGIVYIVIGVLAIEAAFFGGGKTTNSQGALANIVQQPFGQFLLALVAIGLIGYALWRFVEAGLDSENKGGKPGGLATRAGYILSGLAYASLACTAVQLITGKPQLNGEHTTQDWTARLLAEPFGQWLIGLVGLIIIGLGVSQIVKGYMADFGEKLKLNELSANQQQWAIRSGRCGYIARGIVFGIIGGFFIEAALHSNPRQAKGIGSALDLLIQQPYGPWLLGVVAAGLVAYGIFMLVEARYRRITV